MEKAVGYIRVSDKRQVDEGNSLTSQKLAVKAYAERQGFNLVDIFVEEGQTAKTAKRIELQRLLRMLASDKEYAQVVLFPKIDRFSRYVEDYTVLKTMLRKIGVRLDSVGEPIEDTPVGRLTEHMLISIAQFDNEIRAERSLGGMKQAVREGRWCWPALHGYRNTRIGVEGKKGGKGNIEPVPTTAPLITEAFMRVSVRTPRQHVRRWLESQGVVLTGEQFDRMLRNRGYIGEIVAFGHVHQASPPFVPIVDRDVFYRVQALIKPQGPDRRSYARDREDFPLRGTVCCPCCRLYTASWSKGRSAKYAYYRCMACSRANIPRGELEETFAGEWRRFKPTQAWIDQTLSDVRAQIRERVKARPTAVKSIEARRQQLERLRDQIAVKAANDVIPDDVARRQYQAIEAEFAELSNRREPWETRESDIEEAVRFAVDFLRDLDSHWANALLPLKKRMQTFFYPNGLIYEGKGLFRTAEYPFLEHVKKAVRTEKPEVVDPAPESPNQILDWLLCLAKTFSDVGGKPGTGE